MRTALRYRAAPNALPQSPLAALAGVADITENDVAALRASEIGLGLRSLDEAGAMLALERQATTSCLAWAEFFVSCLLDYIVWDRSPSGSLGEADAVWLIDGAGETPSPAVMALLIAVLEEAHAVPAWFGPAVRLRGRRLTAEGSLVAS